ncbi:hypothetical protein LXA43DRAFT_1100719 [Ganoderma leucocontextum]|nr:hypothetical protein LXA43DRAFT_1100719 [Ganoderma leucocontextum]
MLLGQKVSRLGLSTNKDKVNAITQLAPPKNVNELYTFLGMMVYFSSYIPFYAWIATPLFGLLKKGKDWRWDDGHQEAFELCKQVLTQAPVRAHAIPGKPYRVYSDACDYGLAAILQQVQPIKVRDLKGTKVYARLEKAFRNGEPIPRLVATATKDGSDVPIPGPWAADLENTEVYIERVIAYWSCILKTAERNYSPTEREALALREGLIKFQPYIEGERILAITDHAALTWSRMFQNVNRRLQTWGATFAAYPDLKIVHRAGRVHSNINPISRLRRRIPFQEGPAAAEGVALTIGEQADDQLLSAFKELGPRFEEQLLRVAQAHTADLDEAEESRQEGAVEVKLDTPFDTSTSFAYAAAATAALIVSLSQDELNTWRTGYSSDTHFKIVRSALEQEEADELSTSAFPQYNVGEEGLIYFEDWNGASRLCVPESKRVDIIKEVHDTLMEGAHSGYHRTYNRIASTYYWLLLAADVARRQKPIAIPLRRFEVVTMDFIPELPNSSGFDNCLVIVDKLTKYGLFIPTTTKITAEGTAKLFFHHVVAPYGLPRQVITDRDT